jgi:hypothetical protein
MMSEDVFWLILMLFVSSFPGLADKLAGSCFPELVEEKEDRLEESHLCQT